MATWLSKYFYLELISLVIIHTRSRYFAGGALDCSKLSILKATTLWLLHNIHNLVDPALYAVWGAVWLFWASMLIYRSETISVCLHSDNLVTRDKFAPGLVAVSVSYYALLFKLTCRYGSQSYNHTRTGFEVCPCTCLCLLNKKNSFHQLICVIQFFMKKILWFSTSMKCF